MTKKLDRLRELDVDGPGSGKICNPSNIVQGALRSLGVKSLAVVLWTTGSSGRMWRPRGYTVHAPGYKTDPNAHWMHHGDKFFMTDDKNGPKLDEALQFAVDWNKRFTSTSRFTEYVRLVGYGPGLRDDWVPRAALEVIEARLKELP